MSRLHPMVNFIYFTMVIGCSMVIMHPVCLCISFFGAIAYGICIFTWKNIKKGILCMTGVMLLTAVMNPAFSHQGVTTICYLPGGNALTLESIYYGIAAAFMLGATLMWFRCISEILTTDKIVYLFGRPFPVLAMLLSLILGFIPKIQRKLREIRYSRNVRERASGVSEFHKGVQDISLLLTWLLQDTIDMADSMKGRGYGLPGRTSYTTFRFTKWDKRMLTVIVAASMYMVVGIFLDGVTWYYYPVTTGAGLEGYTISLYVVYGILCFLPVVLENRG